MNKLNKDETKKYIIKIFNFIENGDSKFKGHPGLYFFHTKKELEEKITNLVDTTKETFKAEMFERSSIGTISEIYDSTEPYEERGAFAQAWSVAEIFRIVLNKR